MLFCKTINSYCKNVVLNDPHIFSINKCCNYTNLDATIHVLTPKLAGQWPMQKSYKNRFLFRKECGQPYDFCRATDRVGRTNCACIIHPRSTIFGTHILTMSSINNIKKIFISDQNILCMCTQYKFAVLAFKTLLIIIVQVIYKNNKFINVV